MQITAVVITAAVIIIVAAMAAIITAADRRSVILRDVAIVIVTATDVETVIAAVTDGAAITVNVTTIAALKGVRLFPLEIRPVAVKTTKVSHNFLKELKFNISKLECHVIILCMAFFHDTQNVRIRIIMERNVIDERLIGTNSKIRSGRIFLLFN